VAPNSSSRLSRQSGKKEGWHQIRRILTFANILILLKEQLGHPLFTEGWHQIQAKTKPSQIRQIPSYWWVAPKFNPRENLTNLLFNISPLKRP
jgi:hypothetical protein